MRSPECHLVKYYLQDPVIDSIKAAVNKLSNSTDLLHYLGKHALIMREELPDPSEDDDIE